jgi:tryptophan-rich sensory protein
MEAAFPRRPAIGPSLLVLFGFLVLTLATGYVAGQITAVGIPGWYASLAKPSFNPPNWIFAPVWTALYAVMAFAAWRVWRIKGWRAKGLALWLVQLALNFAWSCLFFGAHDPGAALADLAVLGVAIFATLVSFGRVDRPAGWLMIPYLGWVSFAGVLNFWVWQLNP